MELCRLAQFADLPRTWGQVPQLLLNEIHLRRVSVHVSVSVWSARKTEWSS